MGWVVSGVFIQHPRVIAFAQKNVSISDFFGGVPLFASLRFLGALFGLESSSELWFVYESFRRCAVFVVVDRHRPQPTTTAVVG
jgi:hypothetical protein